MIAAALVALLGAIGYDTLCAPCHGSAGAGDGPAAHLYEPRPSDFTRAEWTYGVDPETVGALIRAGVPQRGMPAFGSLDEARLAALTERILGFRGTRPTSTPARSPWPTRPLPPQGDPAPLALDAAACGVCHPAEHAAWRASRHARATDPGVVGQYHGAAAAQIAACDACHAPLAEQRPGSSLHREGVNCAGCHLRGGLKHGPPEPVQRRLPAPGMRARPAPAWARADFCLPCHNLPLSAAVAGRPLLDTWREWAASPWLPAGVQCQHCHQPDGHHGFRGAHDLETVRGAVRLEVGPTTLAEGTVEVTARVHNVGAGHHFPTTATPRAVLRVRQLGPAGPLAETERSWAIGRTLERRGGQWVEVADTRIPAGAVLQRTYRAARDPRAERVEVSLHLFPDWYYARFYRARLAGELPAAARADLEAALADAEESALLVAFERRPL